MGRCNKNPPKNPLRPALAGPLLARSFVRLEGLCALTKRRSHMAASCGSDNSFVREEHALSCCRGDGSCRSMTFQCFSTPGSEACWPFGDNETPDRAIKYGQRTQLVAGSAFEKHFSQEKLMYTCTSSLSCMVYVAFIANIP